MPRDFFLGYGSNTLSGMTKASLDPHGHLRQPGIICYIFTKFFQSTAFDLINVRTIVPFCGNSPIYTTYLYRVAQD